MQLTRTDGFRIVLVVVCVLSLAMAGATLNDPITYSEEGSPLDMDRLEPAEQQGEDKGSGEAMGYNVGEQSRSPITLTTCIPWLTGPIGIVLVGGLFVGVTYGLYRYRGLSIAILGGYSILPPLTLGYFAVTSCPTASPGESGSIEITNAIEKGGQGVLGPANLPPWLIVGVFGIALTAGIVLLWKASGEREFETLTAAETAEDTDASDLAAAAAQAADRIEEHNADVNNAVFRAWKEMTAMLTVDTPGTMTAGEFAEAAIETGMARDHVEELTQLFDEVRYSEVEPTDEHEFQAVDVLRTIEAEYGAGSSGGAGTSGQLEKTDVKDGSTADDTDEVNDQ